MDKYTKELLDNLEGFLIEAVNNNEVENLECYEALLEAQAQLTEYMQNN